MLTLIAAMFIAGQHPVPPLPGCATAHGNPGDTPCVYVNPATGDGDYYGACAEEDGNPDGRPCLWTDPGTGRTFYVTSEDYR